MALPMIAAGIAARAVAKKVAQTAAKKATKINTAAAKGRTIGSPVARVNPQGKLKVQEYMTGLPVKGKIKNIKDTAQLVEHNAGSTKKITSLKYPPKDLRSINSKTNKPATPKVPVKPRKTAAKPGAKRK